LSPYRRYLHQSPNKAALDTPLKSTSSPQQGNEQTHHEIDPRISQEINGCIYKDTKGFYEKYFEGRSWSPTVEKIIRAANPRIMDGRWTDYPKSTISESLFRVVLDFSGSVLSKKTWHLLYISQSAIRWFGL
jgi:hypothetical protein